MKNNTNEDEYSLIGYNVINTLTEHGKVKRGVCRVKDGCLTELIESSIGREDDGTITASPLSGEESFTMRDSDTVSMNMLSFSPKLFDHLEEKFVQFFEDNKEDIYKCEFLIPTVVSDLIQEGKVSVKVLPTTARWQGVTYKEDKDKLVEEIAGLIRNGDYPTNLWG